MEDEDLPRSRIVVASALFVVGSCSALTVTASAAPLVERGPPAAGELRSCGTRGDSSSPQQLPTPPGVQIGPLVIWPSARTRVESARNGSWRFYVKAPVVLPARTKVVLAIAPRAVDLAAFQSARRPNTWVSSVRFEACRESEPAFPGSHRGTVGKYTGFPFGFALARRPACIPMELWIDGETAPIRRLVPFGRRSCYA